MVNVVRDAVSWDGFGTNPEKKPSFRGWHGSAKLD
jgi:hypothetical protein